MFFCLFVNAPFNTISHVAIFCVYTAFDIVVINSLFAFCSYFSFVVCSGFSCDNKTRCIPSDWRCDGHVDCLDQSDEAKCHKCGNDTIYCGENRCMSSQHVCDGEINCPFGQDERNCGKCSVYFIFIFHLLKIFFWFCMGLSLLKEYTLEKCSRIQHILIKIA